MSTGVDDTRYRDDAVYGNDGRRANATTRAWRLDYWQGCHFICLWGVLRRIISQVLIGFLEGLSVELLLGFMKGLSASC